MEEHINTLKESAGSFMDSIPYLEMGSGFMLGLSVGYFFKKSFKLLLLLGGLTVAILFLLDHQGIIHIDSAALQSAAGSAGGMMKQFGIFLKEKLGNFELAGGTGAIAGFFVGLKLG